MKYPIKHLKGKITPPKRRQSYFGQSISNPHSFLPSFLTECRAVCVHNCIYLYTFLSLAMYINAYNVHRCCHLLRKLVNLHPLIWAELKMKIQIRIAKMVASKAFSAYMCCHLLKKLLSSCPKFQTEVRFHLQKTFARNQSFIEI